MKNRRVDKSKMIRIIKTRPIMGGDLSREEIIPENINDREIRHKIITGWNIDDVMQHYLNKNQRNMLPTLSHETVTMAGQYMADFFETKKPESLKLLEIMAGNRIGSSILFERAKIPVWITTDICSYETICDLPFHQLNSVEAVSKFGSDSNILLLLSPPPASCKINTDKRCVSAFADYYACHDFIDQESKLTDRYIVFIGELGASDGTSGMYNYLNENENLSLEFRKVIISFTDMFGGPCDKEIFIYRINDKK